MPVSISISIKKHNIIISGSFLLNFLRNFRTRTEMMITTHARTIYVGRNLGARDH
jgi:hypothetical protein